MNRLHLRITAPLALTLAVLSGCGRHSSSEHYYLIATNINLGYWQTAEKGLKAAAQEYHVTAEMRGPGYFDPKGEVQDFRSAVAAKPAGILVSVADADLMRPAINDAMAAGVPVITVDADAPDSQRLYFIGTNNREAGRLGGERVLGQLNAKGNVVFFTNPTQKNLDDRLKGYKDVFDTAPGMKVVEVFDMKGDPATALDKTQEYLNRTGPAKIDAFICLEAAAGVEVAEALKRHGPKTAMLMAMDVDPETLRLIQDGEIDATISQKPYTMAYLGLKALGELFQYPLKPLTKDYSLENESPIPAFVDTGVALVDKGNVNGLLKAK